MITPALSSIPLRCFLCDKNALYVVAGYTSCEKHSAFNKDHFRAESQNRETRSRRDNYYKTAVNRANKLGLRLCYGHELSDQIPPGCEPDYEKCNGCDGYAGRC